MKLKIIVGIPLFLFLMAFGNIALLGLAKENFLIEYAIFAAILMFIIILSIRKSFEGTFDYVIAILLAIIMVGSMTYCADNLREYLKTAKDASYYQDIVLQENVVLEQQNAYYSNYINYTQTQLNSYVNNIKSYQAQIERIIEDRRKVSTYVPVVESVPETVVEPNTYKNYYEDDEDYEDD